MCRLGLVGVGWLVSMMLSWCRVRLLSRLLNLFLWQSRCNCGVFRMGVSSWCVMSLGRLFEMLMVRCIVGMFIVLCMCLGRVLLSEKIWLVRFSVVCLVLVSVSFWLVGLSSVVFRVCFSLCIWVDIVCIDRLSFLVVCVSLFFLVMVQKQQRW